MAKKIGMKKKKDLKADDPVRTPKGNEGMRLGKPAAKAAPKGKKVGLRRKGAK